MVADLILGSQVTAVIIRQMMPGVPEHGPLQDKLMRCLPWILSGLPMPVPVGSLQEPVAVEPYSEA